MSCNNWEIFVKNYVIFYWIFRNHYVIIASVNEIEIMFSKGVSYSCRGDFCVY